MNKFSRFALKTVLGPFAMWCGAGLLLCASIAVSPLLGAAGELSIVSTFACGAFALVAVVQGAVAAKLINTPTAKDGLISSFQFKMAILGGIETLAIFALVGTIVFSARFST